MMLMKMIIKMIMMTINNDNQALHSPPIDDMETPAGLFFDDIDEDDHKDFHDDNGDHHIDYHDDNGDHHRDYHDDN